MRLKKGERAGLLDSGATHPLRPIKRGENKELYEKVQVALADGQTTWLPITPGGVMITEDQDIEPIIPMGQLTKQLDCKVTWSRGSLEVIHPVHGKLPVDDCEGCPQVPKKVAIQLIDELEQVKKGMKFKEVEEFEGEMKWMKELVEKHPVLASLPEEIKKELVVMPSEGCRLPANRRKRKRMKRDGFIVHLYAGPEEGFTLSRAWQQIGGKKVELLEVDLQRGPEHNMLKSNGVYPALLKAVLSGQVRGLVGGPNCRTRSVLRHVPVPGPDPPRPIRRWGGEEFGIKEATQEEKQKLWEDDVLLWRMVFLGMVASHLRKARREPDPFIFSLEQPASPREYKPEVVSFWDTPQWTSLKEEFEWEETTFSQRPLGGAATKPTTFGGNLQLTPEDHVLKSMDDRQVTHSL